MGLAVHHQRERLLRFLVTERVFKLYILQVGRRLLYPGTPRAL